MEELFEKILDKDEKIVKVFKPHKGKFFCSVLLSWGLCLFMFAFIGSLAILFPDEGYEVKPILLLIPIGFWVISELLVLLFSSIYYKNLYYAYSNKRIIIRSGVFGVDFRSLDMSMIGAVNVYVSLLDKIIKKDTGSIMFGSTASPIGYQSSGSIYKFNNIQLPYETCKEVKSYIDEYKQKINSKN